ncbi:MAG: hypothetical protein R6U46_05930 [Marinilabilia sp.]
MKKRRKKDQTTNPEFRERACDFLERNHTILLILVFAIYVITSFFTFNVRISEGGDDSTYIIRALDLLEEGKFPKYQGPFYPIILAGVIALSGTSIILLKITSWVFLTLALLLFFRTFHKRVSNIVLWGTLLILIVNHHFLYFGSQTYSEAFFMLLQGIFFLYVFHTIDITNGGRVKHIHSLILALLLFGMIVTRTVAIAALPSVIIFLILKRQYRSALTTALFLILFAAMFTGVKSWLSEGAVLESEQMSTLMWENPYDESEGKESFGGFLERFAGNSNIYLSKYFPILTGFKPAMSLSKQPVVTILLYIFFLAGFIRFLKKRNDPLLFTGLYLAFMLGVTFFSLQTLWDQVRLIIPFFPFMVLFLGETIASFVSGSRHAWKQKALIGVMLISTLLVSAQTIKQNDFTAIFKNLSGDRYYGYTPDWQNYLQMAEYAGDELPDDSYVACRKPNMARLYADGKEFYGIYRFESNDPDSLLTRLYERDITHIMVASLRKNPRENTGQVINTIHRYMSIIADAYPEIFSPVKKFGEDEPALLYRINYDKWPERPEAENQ